MNNFDQTVLVNQWPCNTLRGLPNVNNQACMLSAKLNDIKGKPYGKLRPKHTTAITTSGECEHWSGVGDLSCDQQLRGQKAEK